MDVYLYETQHPDGSITRAPHKAQQEIIDSDVRFKVVVCGRRWGKTMMVINGDIEKCLGTPNRLVWYVGPTYRQAKMIAWRYLLSRIRLFPKQFQKACKINESYLSVTWPNNSVYELKGVDNADSLRGQGQFHISLDEYSDDNYARQPVWEEILRPSLSDQAGSATFISTPKGYNHLYDRYEYADSGQDPNWKAWRMPTSTNPYISKKELDDARRELGDDAFSQEYEAEFRARSGMVYKEFSRDIHVIDIMNPEELLPKWTFEVGLDFGSAHPTAASFVMFDHIDDVGYIVDEYYQAEKTTAYNVGRLHAIEARWFKKPKVRWADSQGKQQIIDYASPQNQYFLSPTVKGKDSVDHGIGEVRKRLVNDPLIRKPKLYICRNCINTIREFENYSWKQTNDQTRRAKDTPEKINDDTMDALRYVISHHQAVPSKKGDKTKPWTPRNPLTGV